MDIIAITYDTYSLLSPPCEIGTLLLCHTDDVVGDAYEATMIYISHADELLSHPSEIAQEPMSDGRGSKSSAWNRNRTYVLQMIWSAVRMG